MHLSTGWMDADGTVQLLLGRAALHGCTEALSYLSSVWTQVVEANDSVLRRARETTLIRQKASDEGLLSAQNRREMQNNLTLSSLLQMILA